MVLQSIELQGHGVLYPQLPVANCSAKSVVLLTGFQEGLFVDDLWVFCL